MKNVIDTTIRRMDDALAIEGRDEFQVYDEDTGTYEWDKRLFLFKPVVKPVSGKSLAWMLAHGAESGWKAMVSPPLFWMLPRSTPSASILFALMQMISILSIRTRII